MMQKYTIDMTVGLVLLLLFGLVSCDDAMEANCPSSFEEVDGIPGRCFFYYEGPTGGDINAVATFSEALEICKGKDANVFEPQTFNEGVIIYKYVTEKNNDWFVWINYRDIMDTASFVGTSNSVFVESTYMGSLSTLGKLPNDWWWSENKNGTDRWPGYHCAVWTDSGVTDEPCASSNSIVCESNWASESNVAFNLKKYINNLNETVATNWENTLLKKTFNLNIIQSSTNIK